jgi:hypothetical protein
MHVIYSKKFMIESLAKGANELFIQIAGKQIKNILYSDVVKEWRV